ncbi:MAG: ligand-binding sensor domain-containing protein [Peptostreptococcaceae bacterium]
MIKKYKSNRTFKFLVILTILISIMSITKIEAYQDSIQFNNITIDDGLSQATCEVLFQDSDGFIWIGTNDGLNRYNGYNFKAYKYSEEDDESIANNYILGIKEDKDKNIWVATINGLSKINTKTDKITNYYDSKEKGNLSNYNIADVLVTKDNKVVVGTANGLNIYDETKDKFYRVLHNKNDMTSQDIYSLDQDEYGNIWVGTYNGLNKIDIKSGKVTKFYNNEDESSLSENTIYKVYCDQNGYVWVGTFNSGVNKIDIKTNEITRYSNLRNDNKSLPGNYVRNILRDNDGTIWIGTDNGLAKYNKNNETFTTYKHDLGNRYSLLNNAVYSIMQDRVGLVWVGTYEGISIFNPNNNIEHYSNNPYAKNPLSGGAIHGIYEDKNGYTWIGTNNKGLNILDRSTNEITYISKEDGLSNNTINTITGKNDFVWVGTNEGLNKININTKEIKKYSLDSGLVDLQVKSLLLDSRGYLWIGTPSGINVMDIKTNEILDITSILTYENESDDKYVSAIYEDIKGDYWIGRRIDGGLTKIDSKTGKITNYRKTTNSKTSISSNAIKTITSDTKGNIWIGTDYGLNKLDNETNLFVQYTEHNGLPNNTIYGILEDDNQDIWLSTNNGISKFEAKKNKFINYNITDGLQSNEFNGNAAFKNNKGELFFGGINGLNVINPDDINQLVNHNQKVVFEEFEVENKTYKNINNMDFKYSHNSIEIKFFYPDFKDSKNHAYFYKVEGLDKDWNLTYNNQIIYKNLMFGKYTFKIKTLNHDGTMSDENSVRFTIKPPVYLSEWAFVVYALIIILVIRYNRSKVKRLDRLVNDRTIQLTEEMEKNNELFDKVLKLERSKNNYFVNLSHELRTPLNVISTTQQLILELIKRDGNIEKERLKYHTVVMRKNTKRLLNLINNIIDSSKIEHGNYEMNMKMNDIVYIVEETSLALKDYVESKSINLVIDPEVEEKIIECDRYEIERCMVNLISNARKFTPEGGSIRVTIEDLNDKVLIRVIDTGIGIPKKYQSTIFNRFTQVVDSTSEEKGGSGLGLTITRSIIEMHNGNIYLKSEEGKGSMFTIVLPVRVNN